MMISKLDDSSIHSGMPLNNDLFLFRYQLNWKPLRTNPLRSWRLMIELFHKCPTWKVVVRLPSLKPTYRSGEWFFLVDSVRIPWWSRQDWSHSSSRWAWYSSLVQNSQFLIHYSAVPQKPEMSSFYLEPKQGWNADDHSLEDWYSEDALEIGGLARALNRYKVLATFHQQ